MCICFFILSNNIADVNKRTSIDLECQRKLRSWFLNAINYSRKISIDPLDK